MKVDISVLCNVNMHRFSHSAFEVGVSDPKQEAEVTWKAALARAKRGDFLLTDEELAAARDLFKPYGVWSEEEIEKWPPREVRAVFLQLVAGEVRESGVNRIVDIYWPVYEEDARAGKVTGNMRKEEDKVYYILSDW